MKRCSACNHEKPLDEFGRDRSAGDGLQHRCKECARAASAAYREGHLEQVRATARGYAAGKRAADPAAAKAADAAYYQAHKEEKRAWQRAYDAEHKRKHGLTRAEFAERVAAQDGRCLICGKVPRLLTVDHDHACCPDRNSCGQCIRGLICGKCNAGLGNFCDDVAILRAAIAYLEACSASAA